MAADRRRSGDFRNHRTLTLLGSVKLGADMGQLRPPAGMAALQPILTANDPTRWRRVSPQFGHGRHIYFGPRKPNCQILRRGPQNLDLEEIWRIRE